MAEKISFAAPALYGDHHVVEVRRVLFSLEGVMDVYASSAFHVIEITYDPQKITAEQLRVHLERTGYLDELPVPVETMPQGGPGDGQMLFRHTAVMENIRHVTFTRPVSYQGRPLWPCPGFGMLKFEEE